jgi:nucleoside-diphosphate-sugar epimerase
VRIFLAGATGVIGARLLPLLVTADHDVTGTTRSPERAGMIEKVGGSRSSWTCTTSTRSPPPSSRPEPTW